MVAQKVTTSDMFPLALRRNKFSRSKLMEASEIMIWPYNTVSMASPTPNRVSTKGTDPPTVEVGSIPGVTERVLLPATRHDHHVSCA